MRDEDLDVLLDAALREYVAQAPSAGIEVRVMARVRMARRSRIWFLAPLFAVAAVVVLAIGLRRPAIPLPAVVRRVEVVAEKAPVAPPKIRRWRRRGGLPQLAQFPSPEPMTDGERALLRFIQRDHDQALAVLDARREDREPPLVTEELP